MITKDIIKILPFDTEFKTKLFNEYDNLDEDTRGDMADALWSGYYTYYQIRLNENIEKGLSTSTDEKGKEKLDGTFFQRMVAKTEKEIQDNLNNAGPDIDLSSAREALQSIIDKAPAIKN